MTDVKKVNVYYMSKIYLINKYIKFRKNNFICYFIIKGSSFQDENTYEDFMIAHSDEVFRTNRIVCID